MRHSVLSILVTVAAVLTGCGDTYNTTNHGTDAGTPHVVVNDGDTTVAPSSVVVNNNIPTETDDPIQPPHDPVPMDTDGDGLIGTADLCPNQAGTADDADRDGLLDFEEQVLATDRCNSDSDHDSLLDGFEAHENNSNPRMADSDKDGIGDGWDLCPLIAGREFDSDGDDVVDGIEDQMGSGICNTDSDSDGLTDGVDPNPLSQDADGDGIHDASDICPVGQVRQQYPGSNDPDQNAFKAGDQDNDGLSDVAELSGVFRTQTGETFVTDPCMFDSDSDGLGDKNEIGWCIASGNFCVWLNPLNPNIDGDEWLDGADPCPVHWGHNQDWDADGLVNSDESIRHSNACSVDSDNDGILDREDEYPAQAEETITRQQYAEILNLKFNYHMPTGDVACPRFVDIDQDDPFHELACMIYLSNRSALPLLRAVDGGLMFEPQTLMTRGQVLLHSMNAGMLSAGYPSWSPFLDVHYDNEAGRNQLTAYYAAVAYNYYRPRTLPDSGGHFTFHPDEAASRCMVVDLLQQDHLSNPYACEAP